MSAQAMQFRRFGKTGWEVSVCGFGAWQLGGAGWGGAKDVDSFEAIHAFLDAGGNIIDTADVYGAGHSEGIVKKAIEQWRVARQSAGHDDSDRRIYVVTKAGRAHGNPANPISNAAHGAQNYKEDALRTAIDASRERLGTETLDLVQLHCPPTDVLRDGAVFDVLRLLVQEKKIAHWGVSVETVEEALLAVAQPDCASVQIIFNCFRLKPAEAFFSTAAKHDVAIIARLPLASGLLTGKVDCEYVTSLPKDDHRTFNRAGEAFDKGETWSGLGEHLEEAAFPAVEAIRRLLAQETPMSAFALRWILMHPEVSIVIPGMRNRSQVEGNLVALALPAISQEAMTGVQQAYDAHVRKFVHHQW